MESIKLQAEAIANNFSTDFVQAVDQLLKFTRDYSNNTPLKKRALALNWDLQKSKNEHGRMDDTQFQSLQSESKSILDMVLAEFAASPEKIQERIKGKNQAREAFLNQGSQEKIAFTAKNVSYSYDSTGFRLAPFDLTLRLGEITAVVGENSSGKSTLIKLIAGEHLATTGDIKYPLFNSGDDLDWVAIKEKIAYIPQRINEWDGSVKSYLHFTAAIKGLLGRKNREEVRYIIQRLGLEKHCDKKWAELSGGIQMRFELARALVWKPKLIILDEPLASLDINAQSLFLRDLFHLAHSHRDPIAILITSQHLHEIERISDRTLFLRDGEVVFNDQTSRIGKDRVNNAYEITATGNLDEIRLVLLRHGITDIQPQGGIYTITSQLNVDADKMLRILCNTDANLGITYFRDISNSTRRMFEQC